MDQFIIKVGNPIIMTPYTTCPIFLDHEKLRYSIQIKPNTFVAQLVSSAADISLVNLEHFIYFCCPLHLYFMQLLEELSVVLTRKKTKTR